MTQEEAIKVLEKVVANTSSAEELRRFKEGLLKLTREAQIDYLARNFTREELRRMGFNV